MYVSAIDLYKFTMHFFDLSAPCGKCPRKELILKQSSGPSTNLPDASTLQTPHLQYIWPSNHVCEVDFLCCYILTATGSCQATVNSFVVSWMSSEDELFRGILVKFTFSQDKLVYLC